MRDAMLTDRVKACIQQCYQYIEAHRLHERVHREGQTFICDDLVVHVGVDEQGTFTFDVQSDCIRLPSPTSSAPTRPACGIQQAGWEEVDFVSVWEEGNEVIELRSLARLNTKNREVQVIETPDAHHRNPQWLTRQYVVFPSGEERPVIRGLSRDERTRFFAFESV